MPNWKDHGVLSDCAGCGAITDGECSECGVCCCLDCLDNHKCKTYCDHCGAVTDDPVGSVLCSKCYQCPKCGDLVCDECKDECCCHREEEKD